VTDTLESTDIIDPWLYSTLSTDAALIALVGARISNTLSSIPLTTPYITFDAASTRSIRGVGGVLLDTDSLYNVKAVSMSGSFNQASAIAARIRKLLDRANVTISTPVPATLACFWELEIRYPEVLEGVQYRHLGGSFRIRAITL
jgi:Protein of unknown function (DUF3168)